jgi:hypothetical protein
MAKKPHLSRTLQTIDWFNTKTIQKKQKAHSLTEIQKAVKVQKC